MKRTIFNGSENGPTFDLPLENELLMLKLKAEFGTECTKGSEELPPEVVHEFLRSVYEYELKFREPHPLISIYEKVGKPTFAKVEAIPEMHIGRELKKVTALLEQHQLQLDVLGDYPDRQIYKFITEEFIYEKIDDIDMKGYVHHFCYEDFYPNYELEIRQRTIEFLTQWFGRKIGEYSWQLAESFVHPDSREFPKEVILNKIKSIFNSYRSFSNCKFEFSTLNFEWDDAKQLGRAYVSGKAGYDATTELGEMVRYEGPFEFYLSNTGAWWSIFYFVFPGFVW